MKNKDLKQYIENQINTLHKLIGSSQDLLTNKEIILTNKDKRLLKNQINYSLTQLSIYHDILEKLED